MERLQQLLMSGMPSGAGGAGSGPYVILCDAGSTGTRLYVYHHHERGNIRNNNNNPDAVSIQVGNKVKPGLSEQNPTTAAKYLLPSLEEAANTMIPSEYHATTPVFVYATGGMRLLPRQQQEDIYDGLVDGLLNKKDDDDNTDSYVPFRIERQNFKTIDGSLEGYYAVLAVNYLAGRLGSDLKQQDEGLLGALDLGGASAQIVFPSSLSTNNNNDASHSFLRNGFAAGKTSSRLRRSVQRHDFFSKSVLGVGSESIRLQLERHVATSSSQQGHQKVVVNNPCYFRGYNVTTTVDNITHVGMGDGEGCLTNMRTVLEVHANCTTTTTATSSSSMECNLLGSQHQQQPSPKVLGNFYAMTLFYHVLHFARDVLEEQKSLGQLERVDLHLALKEPNPSLETLRDATTYVCDWDYLFLQKRSDVYAGGTSLEKMPHRCLELALVVTLLEKFGFDDSPNNDVYFVDTIQNQTAEWTLGAFLHQINNHAEGEVAKLAGSTMLVNTPTSDPVWVAFLGAFVLLTVFFRRRTLMKPTSRLRVE